jgi:hypothetical protein
MNGANIVDLVFEPSALSSVEGSYKVLPQSFETKHMSLFQQPASVKFRSALAMCHWGILV